MDISVIICTYDCGKLIGDALKTLAHQTYRNFEVIVIDDGSSDETSQVVAQFRFAVPGLRYLRKAHSGLADSRNSGIRQVAGDYIAFLDADDLWHPSYLVRMRNVFEAYPRTDFAFSNGLVLLSSGRVIRPFFPSGFSPLRGSISSSAALFSFLRSVTPSAMVIRRAAFEQVGGFDLRYPIYGQDWHWLIRAALHGLQVYSLEERLVVYRLHANNLTRNSAAMFEAWLNIYADLLRNAQLDAGLETQVRRFTHAFIRGLLGRQSGARARILLRQALGLFPNDRTLRIAWGSTLLGLPFVMRCLLAGRAMIQISRRAEQRALPASAALALLESNRS